MMKMETLEVTTVIFRVVMAAVILGLLFKRYFGKNKRHVKMMATMAGPRPLPIVGDLLIFAREPEKSLSIGIDLCQKYDFGPIKFWFVNELVVFVVKTRDVELVLSNMKILSKPYHYDVLIPFMGKGLFTNDELNTWKLHRKIITPAFHFNILKGFIPIFFEEASIFVKMVKPGKEMDVHPMAGLCALDIICRTAMGVRVHSQSGKGKSFVKGMEKVLQIAHSRLVRPWLRIESFFKWSSLHKEHVEACEAVHSFTENIIKKKKQELFQRRLNNHNDEPAGDNSVPGAFLDIMLGEDMDGHELSDDQLRDETITMLIGGQETTTTEITFTLLMLALHQEIQTQVLEEIDTVFQGDTTRVPTFEDVQQLHLLERVIKETMRLFPSIPIFGRQLDEDVDLANYIVPKGCMVAIFVFGTHRDPRSYSEPDKFNPDNFLPERCRERSPFAFIPFSAGPRNCIGQKYALLQMKTVVSTILRHYTITPGSNIKRLEDITLKMEITMKSEKPVKVIFTPRHCEL